MAFNFDTFGTPAKEETKTAKPAEKKNEPAKKVAGKFDFDSFGTEATTEEAPAENKSGGIKGFAKSLVSAPLTIIARPFQAVAELAGAKAEDVDRVTKKITGGFVAPVPQNAKDVKKDVGRAIQTVAAGAAGPVSAGAGLGFGASLEQGNDVFSKETLAQTAGGAVAGKVLGLASKPVSKVIDKVTPGFVKKGVSAVTTPVSEFMASHEILPKAASNVINKGAVMAEKIADAPFVAAGKVAKAAFTSSPEKVIQGRVNKLQRLEDNNSRIRKYVDKQVERGFDPKTDPYTTDLLAESVDKTGTIRTKNEGGAVSQYNEFIKPQEGAVSDALKKEGKKIPLKDVEKKLIKAVEDSGVKGASRTEALSKVNREIEGYKMELDPRGTKTIDQLEMPISAVHDAKVDKYANVNYLNENGRVDKAIAKALKQIVEKNTTSMDVAAINRELSKHYANIGYLEKLDGAKVEGGKLGKYFAKTIGAVAGSHFGPLGTIAGAEMAGAMQGRNLEATFGKKLGVGPTVSPAMQQAIENQKYTKLPVKHLPSEYTNELPTIPFGQRVKPKKPALPVIK